jgi:hypothetical protein
MIIDISSVKGSCEWADTATHKHVWVACTVELGEQGEEWRLFRDQQLRSQVVPMCEHVTGDSKARKRPFGAI